VTCGGSGWVPNQGRGLHVGGGRELRRLLTGCAGRCLGPPPLRWPTVFVAEPVADRGGRDAGGTARPAWHRVVGRRLSPEALASLGITRGHVPAPWMWYELFQAIDMASLEAALGVWRCGGSHYNGRQAPARQRHGCGAGGALVVFSDALDGVVGQLQIAARQ